MSSFRARSSRRLPRCGVDEAVSFRPYLQKCRGNIDQAVTLRELDRNLAGCLTSDILRLEEAIVHAYDKAMTEHLNLPGPWTKYPERLFPKRTSDRGSTYLATNHKEINSAKYRAEKSLDRRPRHDDIVDQLMLGFWVSLTHSAYDKTLWRPALHHVYPPGTDRNEVHSMIRSISKIRNKLTHGKIFLNQTSGSDPWRSVRLLD